MSASHLSGPIPELYHPMQLWDIFFASFPMHDSFISYTGNPIVFPLAPPFSLSL